MILQECESEISHVESAPDCNSVLHLLRLFFSNWGEFSTAWMGSRSSGLVTTIGSRDVFATEGRKLERDGPTRPNLAPAWANVLAGWLVFQRTPGCGRVEALSSSPPPSPPSPSHRIFITVPVTNKLLIPCRVLDFHFWRLWLFLPLSLSLSLFDRRLHSAVSTPPFSDPTPTVLSYRFSLVLSFISVVPPKATSPSLSFFFV